MKNPYLKEEDTQSIRRYISSQGTHIKFPAGSRHTIYKIEKIRKEYHNDFGVFPDDNEIAEMMGMSKDVVSSIRAGMQWPVNIDQPMKGFEGRTYAEVIPDEDSGMLEEMIDRDTIIDLIKTGFNSLTKQEEMVLRLRFGIKESDTDCNRFPTTKQ